MAFIHGATIIWPTVHMPDEYRLTPPRLDPERIDLAEIKTDLEFAIDVAVGFVSGLLVLSARIIGRLLRSMFPPPPNASQLTVSHTGEERITITRDAT